MVRRLTRSGSGVEVVIGKAGTGKTFALDAWEAAGIRVTGAALAARAALEVQAPPSPTSTSTIARSTWSTTAASVGGCRLTTSTPDTSSTATPSPATRPKG